MFKGLSDAAFLTIKNEFAKIVWQIKHFERVWEIRAKYITFI